jgi:hypothetical protein
MRLQQQVITPSAPQATPRPTANWQTYSNAEAGITFNYPDDWELSTTENNHLIISLKKLDLSQDKIDMPGDTQENATYTISLALPPNEEITVPAETHTVQVGTISGITFEEGAAPASGPQTVVVVGSGPESYIFRYDAMAHEATHGKYLPIFNQLLSTVQFKK